MHRRAFLRALNRYGERFPEEHGTTSRFAAFVEANADCFERHLACGHVTGSAWIVRPYEQTVLLTHHKKLGRWLQLGGHADGQADPLAVALREAEEESGMRGFRPVSKDIFDVDIHLIPARKDSPAHYHYDVRYALWAPPGSLTVSEESLALEWVALDSLPEFTDEPSMLRMAEKWRSQLS